MKFIITALLALQVAAFAQDKITQELFLQEYLGSEDNQDALYLLAARMIEQNQTTITPSELVEKFKQKAKEQEVQNRFATLYTQTFTPEEITHIQALFSCELYKKYKKQGDKFLITSHMESAKLMGEIIGDKSNLQIVTNTEQAEVVSLTKSNLDTFLHSTKYAVVDVYAPWCAPCKYLAPIIQELANEHQNVYAFGKFNAEEESELAQKWDIAGFPTILFFMDGKVIGRHVGFVNKDKLNKIMKSYFEQGKN